MIGFGPEGDGRWEIFVGDGRVLDAVEDNQRNRGFRLDGVFINCTGDDAGGCDKFGMLCDETVGHHRAGRVAANVHPLCVDGIGPRQRLQKGGEERKVIIGSGGRVGSKTVPCVIVGI